MPGIFISYRREDSAGHAGRLFDRLVEHFGNDCVFLDVAGIEPGVDFVEAIEEAVGSSDVLVVVIGREWLNCTDAHGRRRLEDPKDFIRLEVATALRRDIRVIPALVQGASMPDSEYLPQELEKLSRRQAVELSDTRWDSDVSLLIEHLEKIVRVSSSSTKISETSVEKQSPPSDMAVLDPTSSNSVFGGRKAITFHRHRIEMQSGFKDKVFYDGREVSSKFNLQGTTTHVFAVSEDGEEAHYVIIMVQKVSLTWRCEVTRNGKIIFTDRLSPQRELSKYALPLSLFVLSAGCKGAAIVLGGSTADFLRYWSFFLFWGACLSLLFAWRPRRDSGRT